MQKKLWLLMLTLVLAVGLTACQEEQSNGGSSEQGNDKVEEKENQETSENSDNESFQSVTLTDKSGTEVTINEKPERIVSVLPSATEIVYSVGAGEEVVGVSKWANYPEEVQDVEKVGDQQLSIEKIVSLEPDLVVADLNNGDDVEALRNAGLNVLVLGSQNLESVYEDIDLVGQATGNVEKAQSIISQMKSEVEDVQNAVSDLSEDEKKDVWIEVGPELYSGGDGSFIDELITLAGGNNIIGDQQGWPQVSEEVVLERNPDVIITTYGYYVEDAVEQVLARKNWQDVKAIQEEQVYDFHGDLLTRPGPRLTEGLKKLAQTLYPELFN
ncbi:ABC transporter substrate-binding protein [Filobacillus milosensis]|uniref:ABC transporter substrate-binding protein n=1 Tax=Filobacillus milosensis TaxID=94137 RepID=A0A4Y8INA8_9BACI|nr:ABC transporter substrate-binding protein [Filobacillus milosensis]TFB21719.1 ABC transporter substrate-binding protein [Filobacillus milosensis]